MFIEIHQIKHYPPSCLNRDESGSPKVKYYGGCLRGEISPYCLNHHIRADIQNELLHYGYDTGIRTRKMPSIVEQRLLDLGVNTDLAAESRKKLEGFAKKQADDKDEKDNKDAKTGITGQILFYSGAELEAIAQTMLCGIQKITDKILAAGGNDADILKAFKEKKLDEIDDLRRNLEDAPLSWDVALYGRMVTSKYMLGTNSAVYMSPAYSTHAVNRDSDYYVATDDLIRAGSDGGAAMMGDVDLMSCVYYQYSGLDTDLLWNNLALVSKAHPDDRDAMMQRLVQHFLYAMAFVDPSGKQTRFAAFTRPDLIMIEIHPKKHNQNDMRAYDVPVSTAGTNVTCESLKALIKFLDIEDKAFGMRCNERLWFAPHYPDMRPNNADVIETYDALADHVVQCIAQENTAR